MYFSIKILFLFGKYMYLLINLIDFIVQLLMMLSVHVLDFPLPR